jgi:hypothetical protein
MDFAAAHLKVWQRLQALDVRELHDDGGAVENGVIARGTVYAVPARGDL